MTEVNDNGKVKDIKYLVMSLSYSNGGFAVLMPAENQECFLEVPKILFDQAGFLPRKICLAYVADVYEEVFFKNPKLIELFQQELQLREVAKDERLIKKERFLNEKELSDYE